MEEGAMISTEKLRRKRALSKKAKKPEMKEMISQRNPLKVVNVLPIPPSQTSVDAQRRGCFRFLRPSTSSKEDYIPRSKSQPRTPKSAPPSSKVLSSRTITDPSSLSKKPRQKPIYENRPNLTSKRHANPTAPALLDKWNRLRPSSRQISGGEITAQEPIFKVDLERETGSFATCTPGGTIKIEDKQLSKTPRSNSTPPIQASISPEIPCGFALSPTPVCFATGHVMAGVRDRRKCRPRGILTIGEEKNHVSRVSSAPPPCAEASVCWFSSPLEIENGNGSARCSSDVQTYDFPNEASVNWLLSPNGAAEQVIVNGSLLSNSSILDAKLGLETTPSSCTGVLRTPTSDSTISPFSMIVQRAEASSGLHVLTSNREKGGYRYDNALEISPFSPKSWSNSGGVLTPSYTSSRRKGAIAPLELDSATEDLKALRFSPRPVLGKCQNDVSPLNSSGFKFGCHPTALNSIDLSCFRASGCNELSKVETKKKLLSPGVRISWREGLLSRIFDMGELDSYQCFFDDEYADFRRDCNEFAWESGISTFGKGSAFGSYEFPVDNKKSSVQMCQSNLIPLQSNSVAESTSTEGVLVSSGDSDWTLFYKNNLFEL